MMTGSHTCSTPAVCAAGSAPGTHGRPRDASSGATVLPKAAGARTRAPLTRLTWRWPRLLWAEGPVRAAGPRAATCCSKAASGTRCPSGASSCPTYAPGTSAAAAPALPASAAASRARAAPRRRSIAACAAATKKYAGRASRCGAQSHYRQLSLKAITSVVTAAHMPVARAWPLLVHALISTRGRARRGSSSGSTRVASSSPTTAYWRASQPACAAAAPAGSGSGGRRNAAMWPRNWPSASPTRCWCSRSVTTWRACEQGRVYGRVQGRSVTTWRARAARAPPVRRSRPHPLPGVPPACASCCAALRAAALQRVLSCLSKRLTAYVCALAKRGTTRR
jgi:hypothetical protein